MEYDGGAKIFKALADPKRLQILNMLASGELCACKIQEAFQISQPTLSHHMKLLCDAQLTIPRKEGKWIHYSLNQECIQKAHRLLDEVTGTPDLSWLLPKEGGSSASVPTVLSGEHPMLNYEIERGDHTMEGTNQTKLYVLTGFLGAGKTTLLLKILEHLKGHRVGIIQNEFGKLGIDGTILRNDDIQMVEINRGSIFCSCLKLNFVKALGEMAKENFEYLFVESSGLGDPSNVEEILQATQAVSGVRYDFKGVICLVDAVNFLDQVQDLETVNRQLKHCHLAVITKIDLVEKNRVEELVEKIRQMNPVCEIAFSQNGNLDLGFLQEDLLRYQWAEGEETTNTEETKPKTLFMECQVPVEKEKLVDFLKEIIPNVYRVKGFFQLAQEGWNQVDVVGSNIDFKPCEAYETSQLVFISKIGPALIKQIFSAWESKVGTEMKLKN